MQLTKEYHFLAGEELAHRLEALAPKGEWSQVIRASLAAFLPQLVDVVDRAPLVATSGVDSPLSDVAESGRLPDEVDSAALRSSPAHAGIDPSTAPAGRGPIEAHSTPTAPLNSSSPPSFIEGGEVGGSVDAQVEQLVHEDRYRVDAFGWEHNPERKPPPKAPTATTPAEQLGRLLSDLCSITRTSLSLWLQKAAADAVRRIGREGYAPGLYLLEQCRALRRWHARYQKVGILGYDAQDAAASSYFQKYRGLSLPFS